MGRVKEVLYRTSGEERYDKSGAANMDTLTDTGSRRVDVVDGEMEELRQPEAR